MEQGLRGAKTGATFLPWKRFLVTAVIIFVVSFYLVPAAVEGSASLPDAVAFMALPFLACFVITGIHTYLGVHVIARGVIFVDLCLAQYRVLSVADPAAPPLFPDDYTDITDLDEDGNLGGDPTFLYTAGSGTLVLFQVAGEGTDGSLGPG